MHVIARTLLAASLFWGGSASAAEVPVPPLPQGPLHYDTAENLAITVEVLARGLNHPWSIAFLPDGSALVTEKNAGAIRRLVDGKLQETPVGGAPEVVTAAYSGLLDIALHPDFANQPYIYLSYNKPLPDGKTAVAYARGRWDGHNLIDTQDIYIADAGTSSGSRLLFGPDGMLYAGLYVDVVQAPSLAPESLKGKLIRLTPEGGIPADNPFIGKEGFRPEIYTYGHRTITGLTIHPTRGDIWATEMGPNGGDEVNLIQAGNNYGWPLASLGRSYEGPWQSEKFQMDGAVDPVAYWMPSISVSGMAFYDGDAFPEWRGDLFVGGMKYGEIAGTGQLQRIHFDANMQELRRESLLADLRQRIRDVKQGPDGYLYVLTDEADGAVLRIKPAR
jgi:glucose/arabinose dehydrogenase